MSSIQTRYTKKDKINQQSNSVNVNTTDKARRRGMLTRSSVSRGVKRSIRQVYCRNDILQTSAQTIQQKRDLATTADVSQESVLDAAHATADGAQSKQQVHETSSSVHRNEVGVQLLSRRLHEQVFAGANYPQPPPDRIALAKQHLNKHGLWGKTREEIPNTAFDLPKLQGKNIDEHFWAIGAQLAEPSLSMAKAFAARPLPRNPTNWVKRSGWTMYTKDGKTKAVDHPPDDILCFDVETLYNESPFSVMACAASPTAWYAWLSPWLLGETRKVEQLIPLGDRTKDRIIVGHNVGYDRQRILEEYHVDASRNAFLDTMSLHVAVSGMCSRQRPVWIKYQKDKSEGEVKIDAQDGDGKLWQDISAINSLKDVAKLHCNIEIDKEIRDTFGESTREEIVENLDELLTYCATDVDVTHKVFRKTFPRFLEICPHPASFVGMIQMGSSFLTVDEAWPEYLERAEETYQKLSDAVQERLHKLAEEALKLVDTPRKWQEDPWLSQLDWTVNDSARIRKLPGYPEWYRDLYDTKTDSINLTVRARISPLLLKLSWLGFPLFHARKHGWIYRVPNEQVKSLNIMTKPCTFDDPSEEAFSLDEDATYFRVPHKDGEKANVGNPLSKGYITAFEDGILTSAYPDARAALEMNMQCSYWISARERIMNQFVLWDNRRNFNMGIKYGKGHRQGMILPMLVPMGTITRRAVENTWLTASNAKKNRVGSELKSMVKAPPGYKIVGADVDSEELWISSLLGDAQFGIHGATALGWMTLEGTKSAGTDLHSKTAEILGISRNNAKIFNYGRIYGAGLKYAIQLLMKFNPALSQAAASEKAQELYLATKGNKLRDQVHFGKPFWHGGTESYMFNCLEDIASMDYPRTPALGCGITNALKKEYIRGDYMPSRINWAVQSSGVDYLHLLLVSMSYLIKEYDIDARFMLSVHDEVRFLVKEEDQYRAALALQVANLWTRALFSFNVKMDDLPQSVAFFSAVDIDHVLRKEADMDCITPSNPVAIPPGESLTVEQILEKTGDALIAKESKKAQRPSATKSSPSELDDGGDPKSQTMIPYKATSHFERGNDMWFLEAQAHSGGKEVKMLAKKRSKELGIEHRDPMKRVHMQLSRNTSISFPKKYATRKRVVGVLDEVHVDLRSLESQAKEKTQELKRLVVETKAVEKSAKQIVASTPVNVTSTPVVKKKTDPIITRSPLIARRARTRMSLKEHYAAIATPKDRKLPYVQCRHCQKSMADTGSSKLIKHLVEKCEKVPKTIKKEFALHAQDGALPDIGLIMMQMQSAVRQRESPAPIRRSLIAAKETRTGSAVA